MNTRIDVALFLWNSDVIELLSFLLHARNLDSCGVEPSVGVERMEKLIVSHSPMVVVFDLAPPYDRSAAVALYLLDRFPDYSFVLTCADSALALKTAPWLSRQILFQKPYEMEEIARIVGSMIRRVPKRMGALSMAAG